MNRFSITKLDLQYEPQRTHFITSRSLYYLWQRFSFWREGKWIRSDMLFLRRHNCRGGLDLSLHTRQREVRWFEGKAETRNDTGWRIERLVSQTNRPNSTPPSTAASVESCITGKSLPQLLALPYFYDP